MHVTVQMKHSRHARQVRRTAGHLPQASVLQHASTDEVLYKHDALAADAEHSNLVIGDVSSSLLDRRAPAEALTSASKRYAKRRLLEGRRL